MKKYDTKKIEIQVLYQDSQAPKPANNITEFIKGIVRDIIINENGKLKIEKIRSIGVRR